MSNKKTFAEKVIEFNKQLTYSGKLPKGFQVLNPFLDNEETFSVMEKFYKKYYHDFSNRRFIMGINPGRHGAGTTGVPFTDTKRLQEMCGISMTSAKTHEVSSVFVYDLIQAYGGSELFYHDFYINSPFALALVRQNNSGKWLNANYYDDKKLFECVRPYMIETVKKHIHCGLDTSEVFILGKKNADFFSSINDKEKFFDKLTILEHPRFIQQYHSKEQHLYIQKYLSAFNRSHT